jgi:hypothetical protein
MTMAAKMTAPICTGVSLRVSSAMKGFTTPEVATSITGANQSGNSVLPKRKYRGKTSDAYLTVASDSQYQAVCDIEGGERKAM